MTMSWELRDRDCTFLGQCLAMWFVGVLFQTFLHNTQPDLAGEYSESQSSPKLWGNHWVPSWCCWMSPSCEDSEEHHCSVKPYHWLWLGSGPWWLAQANRFIFFLSFQLLYWLHNSSTMLLWSALLSSLDWANPCPWWFWSTRWGGSPCLQWIHTCLPMVPEEKGDELYIVYSSALVVPINIHKSSPPIGLVMQVLQ